MESHSPTTPTTAAEDLAALAADRDRLAARVKMPWALLAGFGAVAAWWVADAATTTPGAQYQPSGYSWLALLGALIIGHLLHENTGIRFRSMGTRATVLIVGIVGICLTLFSISLGLVSLDLRWAVGATSLAAFLLTTWLSGLAFRAALENLRRG